MKKRKNETNKSLDEILEENAEKDDEKKLLPGTLAWAKAHGQKKDGEVYWE